MLSEILCGVAGLEVGVVLGGYVAWKYLKDKARGSEAVELLKPLVAALVAQSTGDVGAASLAIQRLTQQAAADAAGFQVKEARRGGGAEEPVRKAGVVMQRGGELPPGYALSSAPIGRPAYDEEEVAEDGAAEK